MFILARYRLAARCASRGLSRQASIHESGLSRPGCCLKRDPRRKPRTHSRFSFVKERSKNWEQEISPEMDVVMGGTRQDRELRCYEMFTIPASIRFATA